jgi:osmoprotectant transport system permease protein
MWVALGADAGRHVLLACAALFCAGLAGVPLGVLAGTRAPWRGPILAAAAFGRTLPSIAVLTLLVPLLGVGTVPAVVALALLALPPILINVDLGIRSASPDALDAALGLGMNPRQRFLLVNVPAALPIALAGIRTATVEVIGSATLATFIGAGGLGDDIVRGLQTGDGVLLLCASCVVAALAFAAEFVFDRVVRAVSA